MAAGTMAPEWRPDVQSLMDEAARDSSAAFTAISEDAQLTLRRFTEGSSENRKGVTLALVSSIFIGASFIIKKKGLMLAGQSGAVRASAGGYSYLYQPMWWVGMLTMIGGEAANLAAYAYAPAIVVTPLGASTIIISATCQLLPWRDHARRGVLAAASPPSAPSSSECDPHPHPHPSRHRLP